MSFERATEPRAHRHSQRVQRQSMDELKEIFKDLSLFEPTCHVPAATCAPTTCPPATRRPLRPPPPPPQTAVSARPLPSTPVDGRELKSVSATHVTTKLRPKTQESNGRAQNLLSYEVTPPRPRGMTEAEKKVSREQLFR